ncbi:hypothetical protein [Streptomyces chartreusis]|uniref:hypothetical protein n=1 Tax=Streptomyces chartreusis TaxID=1969 RepID=UPI0038132807
MGLYHSVGLGYGFEIPADTDIDQLDQVIGNGPDLGPDGVGHVIVGDLDQLLLVTRYMPAEENTVVRLAADNLASPAALATWEKALHTVALRLGYTDHPAPAWLLIHNYR